MNSTFSFIVLTYNEEIHLPRLLESIKGLTAQTFIVDSFSTDNTLQIATDFGAVVLQNEFINHPLQWQYAIENVAVKTPWTIGLDADQIVTPELFQMLRDFKEADFIGINGVYFNRKNIFRGKWIRFGGFYPKYLLKMFRTGMGYSDINENMDHRFVVEGNKSIWKKGHIIEENTKENNISFWIEKHNRYSDLVATEEIERINKLRDQTTIRNILGSPDERMASLKYIWWKLPLGLRPFLYFFYRFFLRLGFLDGSTGSLFHFLQGFWFRLIVDVKIKELIKRNKPS